MELQLRNTQASDGVRIAYATAGTGPALVFMPPTPLSNLMAEWRIPLLRRAYEGLAARFTIVLYDARGTGRSQRDVADFSLEAMLRDLEAVVAAERLDRFALFGMYASCLPAIAYAARHPDRVPAMLLFGGSTRGWNPMSGTGTQALLSLVERDWDTFGDAVAHAWLGWPDEETGRLAVEWFRTATTAETASAAFRALGEMDVSAEAGAVRCPVLVLHRRDAQVIPLEMSAELAASLPAGRLEVLEGTSASLFVEHTDELVEQIAAFLGAGPARELAPHATPSRPAPLAAPSPDGSPRLANEPTLTAREREVLRLLARGETNSEIGRQLGISVNTVERHVANLYRKIDARGRADATGFAIRKGLA